MNSEQTLEMKVKSKADEAVKSLDKLLSSLNQINTTVSSIDSKLTKTSGLKKAQTEAEGLNSSLNKAVSSGSKLGKALSLGTLYLGVKRLASSFLDWQKLSIDFTEQLNLFNVVFKNVEKDGVQTFSTLGQEATKFQNKLNEAFGTNKTDTLKYQALFQSMGENVGIPAEYAAKMSETMTKFTYDLASLYNKDENVTGEALRAGVYAGQTKPLRSFGIDVTQTSMQPILGELGIDKTVKELSQAEKEILRYIATLRQGSVAMGDFANTIDSPANQLKVFKQQLVEAKVALTSLFINAFAQILPYANAILMVIKEIAKAIATLFGIKLKDYNTGVAGMNSYADSVGGVGNSAGKAAKKVKELKREVLGFDQINNINENKDTGSGGSGGSGGGVGGGIDQRLLDAIKGYDNGMEKVRMKATAIRDKIMEWLGFTKHVNAETGETYFTLDNTDSTLYKIIKSLKDIVKYGKDAIVGVFNILKKDFDNGVFGNALVLVFRTTADLLKFIAKHKAAQQIIAKLVEAFLMFKVVSGILKPFVNLWNSFTGKIQVGAGYVQTFAKQLKGTNNYILDANGNLKQYNKSIEGHSNVVLNADKSVNKWQTALSKGKTALLGLVTAAVGLVTVHNAMKSISDEGPNVTNVLEGIVGSLSTIGGFATIGSIFGPIGTAVGAAAGAVATLVTVLATYETAEEKALKATQKAVEKSKEYTNSLTEQIKTINNSAKLELQQQTYYESLVKELENLVDANGRVKAGYEDRVSYIVGVLNKAYGLEIELIGNQIKNNDGLVESIYKVIQTKKQEIALSAAEEKANIARENKVKLAKEVAKWEEKVAEKTDKVEKIQKKMNTVLEAQAKKFNWSKSELESYSKSLEKGIMPQKLHAKTTWEAYNQLLDYNSELNNQRKILNENNDALTNATNNWNINQQAIMDYESMLTASVQNDSEELNKSIDKMATTHIKNGKIIKDSLIEQLDAAKYTYQNTVNEAQKKGRELTESEKYYAKMSYNEVISNLTTQTEEVKNGKYSKELKESWKKLAEDNNTAYYTAISQLPDKQRKEIEKMVGVFAEKTPESEKAADKLGKAVVNKMKKDKEAKQVGTDTIKEYLSGMNKEDQKRLLEDCGVKNADKVMKGLQKGNLSNKVGQQIVEGLEKGLKNDYWQGRTLTAASGLSNKLLSQFKKTFGIKSPSRKTREYGIQLLRGIGVGFDREQSNLFKQASNLSNALLTEMSFEDVKLPNNVSLNANKMVDFNDINGTLSHKTSVAFSNDIIGRMSSNIAQMINSRPIDVSINAKTDRGTILETAVNGINEQTKQTGVCPIKI